MVEDWPAADPKLPELLESSGGLPEPTGSRPPIRRITSGLVGKDDAENNRVMRTVLTVGMVLVLIAVTVIGGIGWMYDYDLQKWAMFVSPIFTIVGVVCTFYFIQRK